MTLSKKDIEALIRSGDDLTAAAESNRILRAKTGVPSAMNNPRVYFRQRVAALGQQVKVLLMEIEQLETDMVGWRDGTPGNHDNRDGQPGQAIWIMGPNPFTETPKAYTPEDWYQDPTLWQTPETR